MPVLLAFGDSNTHGTPPLSQLGLNARHAHADRWVTVMQRLLDPAWEVIAEGHPGRTTLHDDPIEGPHRNGLRILPSILESHRPIDQLLLMLGTNDLKPIFSVSAYDIGRSVARLLAVIKVSGAVRDVIVIAPPPVRPAGCLADMFLGAEARGAGLERHIERAAQEAGYGFLDAGLLIQADPLDGVHLSVAAHKVLGQALAAAVRERLA